MAEHFRTCKQLREIIRKHAPGMPKSTHSASVGSENMMKRLLSRFLMWKKGFKAASKILYGTKQSIIQPAVLPAAIVPPTRSMDSNKRRRTRGGSNAASGGIRLNHDNEEIEAEFDPEDISLM